jgi:hypothetical protein
LVCDNAFKHGARPQGVPCGWAVRGGSLHSSCSPSASETPNAHVSWPVLVLHLAPNAVSKTPPYKLRPLKLTRASPNASFLPARARVDPCITLLLDVASPSMGRLLGSILPGSTETNCLKTSQRDKSYAGLGSMRIMSRSATLSFLRGRNEMSVSANHGPSALDNRTPSC